MAPPPIDARFLLVALVLLIHLHFSASLSVKGSVTCMDCSPQEDLAGVRVGVKCSHEKSPGFALTDDDGSFEAEIPSNSLQSPASRPPDCFAVLLGGPEQLWAFKKSLVSKVVKVDGGSDSYTVPTPFTFFSSRPSKYEEDPKLDSSKTIDLPLPPEWGLAPSSYYLRFFPIIGIP